MCVTEPYMKKGGSVCVLLISLTESMTEREQMQTHCSANKNPTQEKHKRLCCNQPLLI